MNYLYLGDCLSVLRESIPDESVNLIYIDPPFNSKRDYNIFFDDKEIQTQRIAFEDTWTLKNIQDSMIDLHTMQTENLYDLLKTYQKVAPWAFPYLVMMALRIVELHRVLKSTGSFYLHCDPTMSHYLKTICDIIFVGKNFRNEIIWQRSFPKGLAFTRFATNHDSILRYTKTSKWIWNPQYMEHDKDYIEKFYKHIDENGRKYALTDLTNPNKNRPNLTYEFLGIKRVWRWTQDRMQKAYEDGLIIQNSPNGVPRFKRYLDEQEGTPIGDIWIDISPLQGSQVETLGYPTQKPKTLLERIIKASSNEGDTILDAFCGCGTTVDAAEGLNRQWIGIDISPVAISLIKRRLQDTYLESLKRFEVRGTPTDEQSAIALWDQNPNAFQDWWLTEFEVFSTTFGTKGADKGIDGLGLYVVDNEGSTVRVAFSVKGGHVKSGDIDQLIGAMQKHKCELGVFLTTEEPTRPMLDAVSSVGIYSIPGYQFPVVQILTLKEFFSNKKLNLPSLNVTFRAARNKGKAGAPQIPLGI